MKSMLRKKAFSLVELIVVVVILGILATISFVSYTGYTGDARDSVNKSNISSLQKTLDVYYVKKGEFPPTSGEGIFGAESIAEIQAIGEVPLDANTKQPYKYERTPNGKGYKLTAIQSDGSEYIIRATDSGVGIVNGNYPSDAFVIKIDTTKTTFWNPAYSNNYESSANNQYELPLVASGNYDFTIDWGDGTSSEITSYDDGDKLHIYTEPGIYSLVMEGTIEGFGKTNAEMGGRYTVKDSMKLKEIEQWGSLNLLDTTPFVYTSDLFVSAIDAPQFSAGMFQYMFMASQNFRGDLSHWGTIPDVITSSYFTFSGTKNFRGDLSGLTFSSVEYFNSTYMFIESINFQGNLSGWTFLNNTTSFGLLLCLGNINFQGNLSNWNIGNTTKLILEFSGESENQYKCNVNVANLQASNLNSLRLEFDDVVDFTGDLSNLPIPNDTVFRGLFSNTTNFQGNLSGWDTSGVVNMDNLAGNATGFNPDLSSWNTSSVTSYTDFDLGATDWEANHKPVFQN